MNETSKYELTIVIPVYNEEDNLLMLEKRLSVFFVESGLSACVLFVDDGSTDGSLDRIKDMCRRHRAFHYIALAQNGGLSAALKAGIDSVESPCIGYMDADLQTAPEDFCLLMSRIRDCELVTGIRATRHDSRFKKLQSVIANRFRRMMTGDGITDTGCPLKVIRAAWARRIPFFNGMHRFLPAMILMMGGRVMEVPVRHFPRTAGVSKYNLRNRLFGPMIDCFAYRWMKRRYIGYKVADSNLGER